MLKKALSIAAVSALSTPAFAGVYLNVENNGSIQGKNWLGSSTDFHVGYEGGNGIGNYYVQGGLNVNAPDAADSESNFSGKVGGSVNATDKVNVYGEFSVVTNNVNSYGTKVGVKFLFWSYLAVLVVIVLVIIDNVTYSGAKAITATNVIKVTGTKAFNKASLNMKKVLTALTILNTVAAVTAFAGIVYVYWYVNNETKQKEIKEFVGGKIKEQLPSLLKTNMPSIPNTTTPPVMKTPKPLSF